MKQENEKPTGLPENAFRPLNEGEEYKPLMSPDKKYPEVNAWSVTWGVLMVYYIILHALCQENF